MITCMQLFSNISWSRAVDRKHYPWLSRRSYKLDTITILFTDLEGFSSVTRPLDILNSSSCTVANDLSDDGCMGSVFHLIECNPQLKKLMIYVNDSNRAPNEHAFTYLRQRCQEVKNIDITTTSAEIFHLAMASFPNVLSVAWTCLNSSSFPIEPQGQLTFFYPNVESLMLHTRLDSDAANVSSLIKACPNLKSLKNLGPFNLRGLPEIMRSCSRMTYMLLHFFRSNDFDRYDFAPMISAMADYGLQLAELNICLPGTIIDIRNDSIRNAFPRLINRLKCFNLTNFECDPDVSICDLFNSPDADLRSLSINTSNESLDKLALLLRSCRNADRLDLKGDADISQVMVKVSDSCRQLVSLQLSYNGRIQGAAMLTLMRSCPLLKRLIVKASLDVQAYEHIAYYGENLICLCLASPTLPRVTEGHSFDVKSPIYDTNFKQHRKNPMRSLNWETHGLYVKSLAKFLSCFGIIEDLSIQLDASLLPAQMDAHGNEEIAVYHARRVHLSANQEVDTTYVDAALLAMMNTCRSMTALCIESYVSLQITSKCFVDASGLIVCVTMCSLNNPRLVLLSYPEVMDLSGLKQLLPKLKLLPRNGETYIMDYY
jgi:hypothetical protein